MGLLDSQRAFVTGGGSGIGAQPRDAWPPKARGLRWWTANFESAQLVAGEIGGIAIGCDVSDHEQVQVAVTTAADELGGLSIVFANAGIGTMAAVGEMDPDEWRRVIEVNLSGVFHTVRGCLPHLIASRQCICGLHRVHKRGAAGRRRVGLLGRQGRSCCILRERRPRVRPGSPVQRGVSRDDRNRATAPLLDSFPEIVERMITKTPAGRIGTPDDIADVVVFLCSDLARFVTGQNIVWTAA